ncbi:hypothetical protein BC834DRAFT_971524 [Gloeopeniophorella convolvens]|nr:hypothetical protein BC834DRAFT_971524 [Gloeopeniophorella convolvens]
MSQTPTSGNQSPQLSLSPPPSLLHSLTRSDSSPPGYYSPSMVRILAAVEFVHTTPVPTIVEPHIDATADPDVLDAHSVETPPGPLGIKFTGYRLLNMTVLIAVGLAKFILSLKGQSTIPTALEWMSGSILAAILYWLGLYEAVQPPRWIWFHHADYAPAIGHFPKYFVGGVMHSVELCWRLLPFILFSNIPTVVIILVQSHFVAFFIDNTVVLVFTNLASCTLPEALMLIFPEVEMANLEADLGLAPHKAVLPSVWG